MTADPFTEAARTEAAYRDMDPGPTGENNRAWFVAGAEWARTHLAAQEPTDAEVEAAARALWAEVWIDPDEHPWDTEATRAERASCRREARAALSAARAARRDEEKR